MDREPEELQFLGLFGIYTESLKLLRSFRRLFTQITLSLILPLSLLFFAHVAISAILFTKIVRNEFALDVAPEGSRRQHILLNRLANEWSAFFIFKAIYLVALLVFSLLSTSAVVYTVASIFTSKDLNFRKVLSIVPKVWRRLMITFLWMFVILFAYNSATILSIVVIVLVFEPGVFTAIFVIILMLAYFAGTVYISVVWNLASVVSVLEDDCGIAAMRKSQALIKGKLGTAIIIFVKLTLLLVLVELAFRKLVVDGGRHRFGVWSRTGYGLLLLGFHTGLIVLALVIQTVFYFVCKSYHHESIDKSSLADHLEVYLGEYVPLKGKDVQLEQFYV